MRISQILGSLFLFGVIVFSTVDLNAQTVVSRARIGGYAEDVAFVTSGALKGEVVMTNGYELYATSFAKKDTLTRICRIDHPEMDQFVNGFTFVESEGLFVMNNAPHPNKLYFFDQTCASKGTRTIQYLNSSYRPGHIEGRLMMLSAAGRVFITDLDGNSRNADGFLLREFNSRVKFGLITRSDIAAITSGPLAGAFAIADGSGGEIVIFRLD